MFPLYFIWERKFLQVKINMKMIIFLKASKSPSHYRSWDQFTVVEFFSGDTEYCLVVEVDHKIVGFCMGTTIQKSGENWKYGVSFILIDKNIYFLVCHLDWCERKYEKKRNWNKVIFRNGKKNGTSW